MSQGGSAQMGGGQLGGPTQAGGQLGGPTQSGMMGGMGGPTQAGGQLGGPTQMGGMPGGQNPIQQAQMQQQYFQGGPLGGPTQAGGPMGGPSGMQPGIANVLAQHPEVASRVGGKGGMPGAQQNPMQQMGGGVFGMRRAIADLSNRTGSAPMQQNPMQQNPMQQQGLASLLKPQQSSTNSLQ